MLTSVWNQILRHYRDPLVVQLKLVQVLLSEMKAANVSYLHDINYK